MGACRRTIRSSGKTGYKPFIYSMGLRNQLGLAINPYNGEIWAAEQGPNGGDEVNVIHAGKNYGWPFVSYGRDYRGPRFNAAHAAQGFEEPTCTGCRRLRFPA